MTLSFLPVFTLTFATIATGMTTRMMSSTVFNAEKTPELNQASL